MFIVAIVVCLLSLAGCAVGNGTYFQRAEDRQTHIMKDRLYNPADFRHERHDPGQVGDY